LKHIKVILFNLKRRYPVAKQCLTIVVAQPDKRHANNRSVLEYDGYGA